MLTQGQLSDPKRARPELTGRDPQDSEHEHPRKHCDEQAEYREYCHDAVKLAQVKPDSQSYRHKLDRHQSESDSHYRHRPANDRIGFRGKSPVCHPDIGKRAVQTLDQNKRHDNNIAGCVRSLQELLIKPPIRLSVF